MVKRFSTRWMMLSAGLVTAIAVGAWVMNHSGAAIDFSSQVKPILNKKCISCHGGVKKQGGFSLLFQSEALAKMESGKFGIVPGHPENSEMIRRLGLKDPEERMPFKHEPLEEGEIAILKQWIKEGAKWGEHWAYVAVKPVETPKPTGALFGLLAAPKTEWVRNDIDYFIYDQQQKEKITPSPEADKATLLRRLSLDLTGMPSLPALAEAYLSSSNPQAYEALVDSLLASPHYGERWASVWMDVARYADTKGYEADRERYGMWKFRDWLIKAFNEDKPYDVFLTEQLAGDLLPEPTDAQYIATAFHRNTLNNDEGGTDNEEFRTSAVLDRVNSTWEGLMGTTFACVQCHSHPYDPFTHDEYYKFVAFFNNTRDEDTPKDYPLLRQYDTAGQLKLTKLRSWVDNVAGPEKARQVYDFVKTWQPSINMMFCDDYNNGSLVGNEWVGLRNPGYCRVKKVNLDGKRSLTYRFFTYKPGGTMTIRLDKPDGPLIKSHPLRFTKEKWQIEEMVLDSASGTHDLYIGYSNPNLSEPLETSLGLDWLHFSSPFPGKGMPGYDSTYKNYWSLVTSESVATTPVMVANSPDLFRVTNVFERGSWTSKGKVVEPDVPHSLNPLPKGSPRNRLGMAMWLTDKKNPLTARTMVNRLWEQLFGTGIVETLEDMGTQGLSPSNKDLLDDLSWKFMNDYHWSVKKLLKEIVMSATYRQDSKISKEMLEKDPYNKFYARGPRVRLSSEQVRDQALFVSGLLSSKIYGPSVKPWQPEGILSSPYGQNEWEISAGENQYRRALYTFWKRTSPYPSMIAFDGASRITCTPRRIRSNTPLQALVTLNDSAYIETARYLAYRMNDEYGNDPKEQIGKAYQLIMYKPISPAKLQILENLYDTTLEKFRKNPVKVAEIAAGINEKGTVGNTRKKDSTAVKDIEKYNNPETAALTVVANAMLNLNEVITKN